MRTFLVGLAAMILPWATARAQSNDNFPGRLPLTGTGATAVSNNRAAGHEPGEPNHAGGYGSRSLWWTWTAPATGDVVVTVFPGGAAGDPDHLPARTLAVYTGTAVDALTEVVSSNQTLPSGEYYYGSTRPTPRGPASVFRPRPEPHTRSRWIPPRPTPTGEWMTARWP